MSFITLTTDFGELDYYVPSFKGAIVRACPSVKLMDISHNIPPFNINIAAYIVKNSFESFPEKSLHIIRVGEKNHPDQRLLAVTYRGHYFVAPDNGVLSMIFEESPTIVVAINKEMVSHGNIDEYYLRAIKNFVFKGNISEIGYGTTDYVEKHLFNSTLYQNKINGVIMHIDNYGNAITNVTKADFVRVGNGKPFVIYYRIKEYFDIVLDDYSFVEEGDKVAIFNSKGFLEIAINEGNASELLGLGLGDTVQIEFKL